MLADSKLPTTFWTKAVNTVCYVQNRVLVVKPHNKTSYELFRGRTPSLSFMKPFGCHVTILNTLDHLGKFDGNSNDIFFVGYSLNSDGPKWLFDIDVLTKSMNYVPVIAGTNSNDFDASNEPQPSNDAEKKDNEGGIDYQERTENSAQDVNTAGPSINTASTNFNIGSLNINFVSLIVPIALLESTYAYFFGDESELDLSNIAITYPVPSTPNTRIHKDHSLDHVIGDMQSGVQTRRMINEQGFISVVYEGKTHEDLHTCLFACFLSHDEPKKEMKVSCVLVVNKRKSSRYDKEKNREQRQAMNLQSLDGDDESYQSLLFSAVSVSCYRPEFRNKLSISEGFVVGTS
ncbi:putative ribonuclease H-like domain-containing protein [Tanacetum coccineum]